MGVGSTDTTLRMGKTRSVAVGLSEPMASDDDATAELIFGTGGEPTALEAPMGGEGHGLFFDSGDAGEISIGASLPVDGSEDGSCFDECDMERELRFPMPQRGWNKEGTRADAARLGGRCTAAGNRKVRPDDNVSGAVSLTQRIL